MNRNKKSNTLKTICLFSFVAFAFMGFRYKQNNMKAFQKKVGEYSKKFDADYDFSDASVKYQAMFDLMKPADWVVTMTLKTKKASQSNNSKPFHKRLFFCFYYYNDSAKTAFALDSVQKCLPPDCINISKLKAGQVLSGIPSVYIFNRHSIVTCHVDCGEVPDNWAELKKDLIKTFAETHSVSLTAECEGSLKWIKK